MTDRLNWIEHNGTKILSYNFKGGTPEDIVAVIEGAEKILPSQPENSVLALIDTTDIKFNTESWDKLKKYAKFAKPYNKATAIVGLTLGTELLLKAVRLFTKRPLFTFDNIEEAKNYLVEQK
ncbi:MAG: hypothetical protein JRI53_01095 [Deltaproteobacteria bacterium]|nr:hypothetical protein [Deltaproteobacteria bacterium]MBW2180893.1 hypothetical protein [Deltaproteobacteria bacterium]